MWLVLERVNKGRTAVNMARFTHAESTESGTVLYFAPPHKPGLAAITVTESPEAIVSRLHALLARDDADQRG